MQAATTESILFSKVNHVPDTPLCRPSTYSPTICATWPLRLGIIDVVGAPGVAGAAGAVDNENVDIDVGVAPAPAVLKGKAALEPDNKPVVGAASQPDEGATAGPTPVETDASTPTFTTVPVAAATATAVTATATTTAQTGATPGS